MKIWIIFHARIFRGFMSISRGSSLESAFIIVRRIFSSYVVIMRQTLTGYASCHLEELFLHDTH
jgi:hypothetical protein